MECHLDKKWGELKEAMDAKVGLVHIWVVSANLGGPEYDELRTKMSQDKLLQELSDVIMGGFPDSQAQLLDMLKQFWPDKAKLVWVDGIHM